MIILNELKCGSIEIKSKGVNSLFEPSYSQEDAVKIFKKFVLLFEGEFYDANTGIDWLISFQYDLFHRFIIPYIQYQDLLKEILLRNEIVIFRNKSKFYYLYLFYKKHFFLTRLFLCVRFKLEKFLMIFHNLVISRSSKFLFFRYIINDFRNNNLDEYLKEKCDFTYAVVGSFSNLIKHFTNKNIFFILPFNDTKFFLKIEHIKNFQSSIFFVAKKMKRSHESHMNIYSHILKNKKYTYFFGTDDTSFLFPFLFSMHKFHVKTFGFQHGLYSKNDFGYSVFHAKSFQWFQKLVVWDNFWKSYYLSINQYFKSKNIVSGIGSDTFIFSLSKNPLNKKILLMHEVFLDMHEYSKYAKKLIAFEFTLVIKIRPGEDPKLAINQFNFNSTELSSVTFSEFVTQEVIDNISVVAGAKTSLLYSLTLCNRPVWIFQAGYNYLDSFEFINNVREVSYKEIDNINSIYYESVNKVNLFDPSKDLFCIDDLFKKFDIFD